MKSIRVLCLFLAFMLIVAGCRKKPTETITPLHQAAQAGDIDKVRILISEGADVNVKDQSSNTPLHYVAGGNTPLYPIVLSRQRNVTMRPLANSANFNAKAKDGDTLLESVAYWDRKDVSELLIVKGADVNIKNWVGFTPLHEAVLKGRKEVAKLLIARGANVNAKDNAGRTPLFWAKEKGHTEIVEFLRKHGAEE